MSNKTSQTCFASFRLGGGLHATDSRMFVYESFNGWLSRGSPVVCGLLRLPERVILWLRYQHSVTRRQHFQCSDINHVAEAPRQERGTFFFLLVFSLTEGPCVSFRLTACFIRTKTRWKCARLCTRCTMTARPSLQDLELVSWNSI